MLYDTSNERFSMFLRTLLIAFAVGAGASTAAEETRADAVPEAIRAQYEALSEAIRKEDARSFMDLFHLNFLFEEEDGATLDRGPWRRRWLELFDRYEYERAVFEPERVLRSAGGRFVVRTRRIVVRDEERKSSRELRESYLEDTWIEDEGTWKLVYRKEPEVVAEGELPESDRKTGGSPRIASLKRAVALKDAGAVKDFLRDVESAGGVLVEPLPESPEKRRVTFVWQGHGRERRVAIRGGRSGTKEVRDLVQLGDTEIWYRTERLPSDARFTYEFVVGKAIVVPAYGEEPAETFVVSYTSPDPLNERTLDGSSLLALPDAPSLEWLVREDGVPEGEVERQQVRSSVLGERRFVTVYTPPGLESEGHRYPAAFVLDGGDYKSRRKTAEVLDAAIARGSVPPVIVFMIHSEGSLRPELEATGEMKRFLAEELVSWAREDYPVTDDSRKTVIGGNGFGGGLAALVAADHSEIFGNVLVESGDFTVCMEESSSFAGPCVPHRFSESSQKPISFHIEVGTFEGEPIVGSSRHMRDVLEAKGYDVAYRETATNHHSIAWWAALARGLGGLLGD